MGKNIKYSNEEIIETLSTIRDGLNDDFTDIINQAIQTVEGYSAKTVSIGKIIEGGISGDKLKIQAYTALLVEEYKRRGDTLSADVLRKSLNREDNKNTVTLDSKEDSEPQLSILSYKGDFGEKYSKPVSDRYTQADLSKTSYVLLASAIDEDKLEKHCSEVNPSLPTIRTNSTGKVILIEYKNEKYLTAKKMLDNFNVTQSKFKRVKKLGYSLEVTLGYCLDILESSLTLEISNKLCKSDAVAVIDGKTYVGIKAIADKLNMTSACVYSRITRGWAMEDIINTPQNPALCKKKEVTYKGKDYGSLLEFANAFNLDYSKVRSGNGNKKSLEYMVNNYKLKV